jgi:hypothetical protein
MYRTPSVTALPVRVATAGVEPTVASVAVRVAVTAPAAVGLYATATAQVARPARTPLQVFVVMLNWAAPAPPRAAVTAPDDAVPLFLTMKVMGSLVVPTTPGNVAEAGLMVKLAGLMGASIGTRTSGFAGCASGTVPPSPGETGVAGTHAPALLQVFPAGQFESVTHAVPHAPIELHEIPAGQSVLEPHFLVTGGANPTSPPDSPIALKT